MSGFGFSHRVSVQCNQINITVSVTSVLNSGCSTWGVYHLDETDKQG